MARTAPQFSLRLPFALPLLVVAFSGCGGDGGGGGSANQDFLILFLLLQQQQQQQQQTPASTSTATGTGPSGGVGTWDAAGSPVPVYVLVGGDGPGSTETDLYRDHGSGRGDGGLDHGEIFVMAKNPLAKNATYRIGITAYTGSGAGTEAFSQTWEFATHDGSQLDNGGNGESTTLAELNAYRADAGVGAFTEDPDYTVAATKHAGYQKIAATITHFEPDTSNDLFVDNEFWDRITIAKGGVPPATVWGGGINTVAEGITTKGDRIAGVAHLWNSVYHRLAKMRHRFAIVGFGNSDDAKNHSSDSALDDDPKPRYLTFDYGGSTLTARTTAFWPPAGGSNIPHTFSTDSESPDPIDPGTGGQTPTTPTDDLVGVPIHVIVPTSADFSGLTVRLERR